MRTVGVVLARLQTGKSPTQP